MLDLHCHDFSSRVRIHLGDRHIRRKAGRGVVIRGAPSSPTDQPVAVLQRVHGALGDCVVPEAVMQGDVADERRCSVGSVEGVLHRSAEHAVGPFRVACRRIGKAVAAVVEDQQVAVLQHRCVVLTAYLAKRIALDGEARRGPIRPVALSQQPREFARAWGAVVRPPVDQGHLRAAPERGEQVPFRREGQGVDVRPVFRKTMLRTVFDGKVVPRVPGQNGRSSRRPLLNRGVFRRFRGRVRFAVIVFERAQVAFGWFVRHEDVVSVRPDQEVVESGPSQGRHRGDAAFHDLEARVQDLPFDAVPIGAADGVWMRTAGEWPEVTQRRRTSPAGHVESGNSLVVDQRDVAEGHAVSPVVVPLDHHQAFAGAWLSRDLDDGEQRRDAVKDVGSSVAAAADFDHDVVVGPQARRFELDAGRAVVEIGAVYRQAGGFFVRGQVEDVARIIGASERVVTPLGVEGRVDAGVGGRDAESAERGTGREGRGHVVILDPRPGSEAGLDDHGDDTILFVSVVTRGRDRKDRRRAVGGERQSSRWIVRQRRTRFAYREVQHEFGDRGAGSRQVERDVLALGNVGRARLDREGAVLGARAARNQGEGEQPRD